MINSRSLDDLRSDVAENCRRWLVRCKRAGLHVLVTQTLRDDAYQAALYAQGRTKPGSIVTNSRVTTFHGAGLAFDFCKNVRGHEYDDPGFFARAAALAKEMGFSWGGDWRSFPDRPHLQWDSGGRFTGAQIRAGRLPPTMKQWEEPMTGEEIYLALNEYLARRAVPKWAEEEFRAAVALGITDGGAPCALIPRYQAAIMAKRALEQRK